MATVKADEVRIPRSARDAVAQHERVVVMNRERPTFVILHPDDSGEGGRSGRGRPLRDALADLQRTASPDPDFATDLEAVLRSVGPAPVDPWAQS